MARRRVKKGRVFILILLIVFTLVLCYFAFDKLSSKPKKANKTKEISSIKEYGYTLKENATGYYKKLFKKLNTILSKDEVNFDDYADTECQMFVADFFNLDNKISKNDVGGVEFIYAPYKEDFTKYAMDGIYKSVLSNVYGTRKQELPVVSKVTCLKVKNDMFKYGDKSDSEAYVFNFDIEYADDLEYQDKGNLTIIHSDKKLEVASMGEEKITG